METEPVCDHEYWFREDEDWIAALARQLFRARRAGDAEAVEVTLTYLEDRLQKVLDRHMRVQSADWPKYPSPGYRWFDGIGRVAPEYLAPHKVRIRSDISWVVGQEAFYYEPFEFELELCPRTGAFGRYVIRFGDHRPLAAKANYRETTESPQGGWAYEFERARRAE
jgi:hypothetical protein